MMLEKIRHSRLFLRYCSCFILIRGENFSISLPNPAICQDIVNAMESKDIRRFFGKKLGGGDEEKRTTETECIRKLQKRKTQQQTYDKTKRKRIIKEEWLREFPWAVVKDENLMCSICTKFPLLADQKSSLYKGISQNFKKETLRFHDKSAKHQLCTEKQKVMNAPSTSAMAKCVRKVDEKNSEKYEKLMNTAYYIAQEGYGFSKFASLCSLQEKNGVNMGTNYRNDHGCKNFIFSASESLKTQTSSDLEKARFVSVLSDGSTDKSVSEQEIVYVRYVNHNGTVCTKLADIVELEHGHAQGVKNGIFKALENVGLPVETLCEKLVGINTDGASVNLGKKGGAVKLMMDDLNQHLESPCNDYMIVVHCIAHKLELAVCDSKRDCVYLEKFEETLKGIFKFYYYSPKKRRELYDIAESLDKDLKNYGGIHQVRWVSSQNRALKSLLDNYAITCIHLEDIASKKGDDASRAKGYLTELKTERFVAFLHFLLDWTDKITGVSESFQKSTCIISEVNKKVSNLEDELTHMKIKRGKNLRTFLREIRDSGEFQGVSLVRPAPRRRDTGEDSMNQINADIDALLNDTVFFLDERFVNHMGGDPHSLFNIFDFRCWPKKDASPQEFLTYGDEEIEKLVEIFGPVLTAEEQTNAAGQWLSLKNEIASNLNRTLVEAYESLLADQQNDNLSSILPIVNIMLTISISTAQCERGFSAMNGLKTQYRSSLKQDSLSNLMRIKVDGPSVEEFNPTESLMIWLNSGKQTKHLKGHKLPGKRQQRVDRHSATSSSDSTSDSNSE